MFTLTDWDGVCTPSFQIPPKTLTIPITVINGFCNPHMRLSTTKICGIVLSSCCLGQHQYPTHLKEENSGLKYYCGNTRTQVSIKLIRFIIVAMRIQF